MNRWFAAGQQIDSIPVADRGFQYGDGLFETIAIREGNLRLWNLHEERLLTSCRRLAIQTASLADLRDQVLQAVAIAMPTSADLLAKIIVTRGAGERGYRPPVADNVSTYIGLYDRASYPDTYYRDGIFSRICGTRLSIQPQTAGMKTLSRMDQVLARAEWSDSSIVEGLMLDAGSNIICGTMSNVFCVVDEQLLTPELTVSGVAGVMRRHIIGLAECAEMKVDVKPITLQMLSRASELFLCNSQFGIWPVSYCGNQHFASQRFSSQLRSLLRDSGVVEGPQ